MTITLNSLWSRQLTFHLVLFLELSLAFWFGTFFSLPILPVCFYALGRSAISSGLKKWPYLGVLRSLATTVTGSLLCRASLQCGWL